MKPSDLIQALDCALDSFIPLMLWGDAGVGKSAIVKQAAEQRPGWNFIDIRAVLLDPVDMRGLPTIADSKTKWIAPEFLPRDGEGILFLDELPAAPPMVQAACYQLILDRKLGEYELPPGYRVIAAGNPPRVRGVHYAMPDPLRNRFWHLTLDPDLPEWCRWAVAQKLRAEYIAFLRFKPELLHQPDHASDVTAWPTPRSNAMAAKILDTWMKRHGTALSPLLQQMLIGAIGEGAAGELYTFLEFFRNLPSTDEILLNPKGARLPTNASEAVTIATALGRLIDASNFSTANTYLERMDDEYHVLAIRDATIRDSGLCSTPEFVKFGVEYQELVA